MAMAALRYALRPLPADPLYPSEVISGHRDPALRAGRRPLISPPRVRLVLPRTRATLGGPFYLDSYVKSANAEYHARITPSTCVDTRI